MRSCIYQGGAVAKKSKSTYEQKRKEAEVAALEQRRMDGDALPQSVDDYEKLIMSSPQSSFVWVKYMAFQIGLTEVNKARRLVGLIHSRD